MQGMGNNNICAELRLSCHELYLRAGNFFSVVSRLRGGGRWVLAAGAGRTSPEVKAADLAATHATQKNFCWVGAVSLCSWAWLDDLAYGLCYIAFCFVYMYNWKAWFICCFELYRRIATKGEHLKTI